MLYSHSLKGRRDQNEDQHFMYNNINGASTKNAKVCYLSVYDGHGGKLVSNYLKKIDFLIGMLMLINYFNGLR